VAAAAAAANRCASFSTSELRMQTLVWESVKLPWSDRLVDVDMAAVKLLLLLLLLTPSPLLG
jgi:hypothetical protein